MLCQSNSSKKISLFLYEEVTKQVCKETVWLLAPYSKIEKKIASKKISRIGVFMSLINHFRL
jgi:hypothetical protein